MKIAIRIVVIVVLLWIIYAALKSTLFWLQPRQNDPPPQQPVVQAPQAKPKLTFPEGFPDYVRRTYEAFDKGNPQEAVEIFRAALDDETEERQRIVEHLIHLHASEWTSAEIYRGAGKPDRDVVFAGTIRWLAGVPPSEQPRIDKWLNLTSELVDLRKADAPDDVWIEVANACIRKMQNDPQAAIEGFKRVLPKLNESDRDLIKTNSLYECYMALNREKDMYRELGPSDRLFEILAEHFDSRKDAAALESLIAEHAQARPDFAELNYWKAASAMLKADYDEALRLYRPIAESNTPGDFKPMIAWERIIRCLIRQGKTDDAVDAFNEMQEPMPWILRPLVLGAIGQEEELKKEFTKLAESMSHSIQMMYDDDDLGPILRRKEYDDLRKKYPPPSQPEKP